MAITDRGKYADVNVGLTETGRPLQGLLDHRGLPLFNITSDPTTGSPIMTILSFSREKVSQYFPTCLVTFSANQDLTEWEVRADGSGRGTGDLLASGGSLSANQEITVSYTQLTWGDRPYRINVYGKNASGEWSVYE